ncbi:MAG: hypothetical protein H0X08_05235 [Blastocatellia bacterium]|nr:hypothetical protein [Blastocatellia bacterium]
MVNKTAIRIIKREDSESRGRVVRSNPSGTEDGLTISADRAERRLHRDIAGRVAGWISDHRENTPADALSEIRRLFGGESSGSEIA